MTEKRVTIAVLVAIAVHTAGVLLWAGAASHRLETVEDGLKAQTGAMERLARVEVKLELATVQLARIEHKLDRAP